MAPTILQNEGYTGLYEVLPEVRTVELISAVTRDGDPKWSDFVNHVLQSLMAAEETELAIGSVSASDFATTDIFGEQYATMFQDVFDIVGTYGMLYLEHLETLVPRAAANQINLGNTAAMYSKPLGNTNPTITAVGLSSPTVKAIKERGYLVVGITNAPMFAEYADGEWIGIDIDFAKAVAAVLFNGEVVGKIRFVVVSAEERFQKLLNKDVDLLARVTTNTMERDVKERTTEKGFTFSSTMFHDSVRFVGSEE